MYTFQVFFFFQAEDGIRDATVTGVQTCALPICHREEEQLRLGVMGVAGRTLVRAAGRRGAGDDRTRADRWLGLRGVELGHGKASPVRRGWGCPRSGSVTVRWCSAA